MGFNAAMDTIDALIAAKVSKPSGISTGEVPVWNGTTWVRSTTINVGPSSLGSGTPSAAKVLAGDGSWQGGAVLLWDSVDAGIALPASSIATPALPQTFKHLRVVATMWSDQAAVQDVLLTINSDTTNANYLRRLVDVGASLVTSGATDRISGMLAGRTAAAPSVSELLIGNYAAVRAHTYRSFSGYVDATPITHTYDAFVSYSVAAAISTLAFSPFAGLFVTGTRISVYGVS